jgi:hypothetical protein
LGKLPVAIVARGRHQKRLLCDGKQGVGQADGTLADISSRLLEMIDGSSTIFRWLLANLGVWHAKQHERNEVISTAQSNAGWQ